MKSLRDLFRRLPIDGKIRHELRNFNLGMIGPESPPSVVELARRLGFDVMPIKMRKSQRGRLVADTFSESGYRIEVNEDDDVRTRRWTVLHELMHALLHPRPDPFAFPQYRASANAHFYYDDELREEREANSFVEALIFGDGALEAAIALYCNNNELISKHFGVSIPTLLNVLKRL